MHLQSLKDTPILHEYASIIHDNAPFSVLPLFVLHDRGPFARRSSSSGLPMLLPSPGDCKPRGSSPRCWSILAGLLLYSYYIFPRRVWLLARQRAKCTFSCVRPSNSIRFGFGSVFQLFARAAFLRCSATLSTASPWTDTSVRGLVVLSYDLYPCRTYYALSMDY